MQLTTYFHGHSSIRLLSRCGHNSSALFRYYFCYMTSSGVKSLFFEQIPCHTAGERWQINEMKKIFREDPGPRTLLGKPSWEDPGLFKDPGPRTLLGEHRAL